MMEPKQLRDIIDRHGEVDYRIKTTWDDDGSYLYTYELFFRQLRWYAFIRKARRALAINAVRMMLSVQEGLIIHIGGRS